VAPYRVSRIAYLVFRIAYLVFRIAYLVFPSSCSVSRVSYHGIALAMPNTFESAAP
jgi:hypothetical protein